MALSFLARAVRQQLGVPQLRPLVAGATQAPFSTEAQQQQQGHLVLETTERYEPEQINTFMLTGNVCAHPVLRVDRSGRPVTNLLLARNRRRRLADGSFQESAPEFYSFLVSGPLAHAVMSQVRKGQKLIVKSVVASRPDDNQPAGSRGPMDSAMPNRFSYSFIARDITLVTAPPRAAPASYGEDQGP